MISNENKKRMVTGVKPTNSVTIGNYLGVIKNLVKYQDEYDLYVFIADLHALTLPIDSEELKQNIENLVAVYLACGLDPDKCTIFKQSQIIGHNDLNWILTCNSNVSDFTKMPQYKNYIEKNSTNGVPAGMLMYPALMAADILLYDADYVPVGIDQMPHVDLCRDIAEKFNKRFPGAFKLPSGVLSKSSSKIMSLSDPTRKMSKSESDKGTIYLLDDIEISKKKIMKALTDSENAFYYDPENKPGLSNLINIYSVLSNLTIEEVVEKYEDSENYGVFKRDLCWLLEAELVPIQKKVKEIKDSNDINLALYLGRADAQQLATLKITDIYKKLGLK